MISRKWLPLIGLCLLVGNSFAQTPAVTTIEVESQGTITFSPDSFVVKLRFDRSSVNSDDRVIETVSEEAVMPVEVYDNEGDYAPAVEVEPPPTMAMQEETRSPMQMQKEIERMRFIQDSLQKQRDKRALEFEARIFSMGVRIPKLDAEHEGYGYRYRSNTWEQNFTPAQYGMIDSISRIYGHPLSLEMVDIKMKDHSVLKERAYRQAIESSKKEAEVLAKAMGRKVGKMITVKTESIDMMDLVPLMLRKEIQREIRKSDRFIQPALYQLSQELGTELFEKDRYNDRRTIYWTWTEKVKVSYQLN
ncbi:MAG: hypothetical protein RLZZ543_2040 [Bacteroidota bacterium]|jgi:hypothetical protein